jgi:hypothetical protein
VRGSCCSLINRLSTRSHAIFLVMSTAGDDCGWSTPSTPSATSPAAAQQPDLTPENVLKSLVESQAAKAETSRLPAKNKLACGFMCQGSKSGRACRKQVSNHCRGAVCPDCMDDREFLRCSNGCLAYVHVGCIANGERCWECLECQQKEPVPESMAVASASAEDIVSEVYQIFDNYLDCHAHLRLRSFRVRNTFTNSQNVITAVKYSCKNCSAHFIVRHDLETSHWQVPDGQDHMVRTSFHHTIWLYTHH